MIKFFNNNWKIVASMPFITLQSKHLCIQMKVKLSFWNKKHTRNKNKHIGANGIHFGCWMNSPLTLRCNPGTSASGLPAVYICPSNRSVPVPFIPLPLLAANVSPRPLHGKFLLGISLYIFSHLYFAFLAFSLDFIPGFPYSI